MIYIVNPITNNIEFYTQNISLIPNVNNNPNTKPIIAIATPTIPAVSFSLPQYAIEPIVIDSIAKG